MGVEEEAQKLFQQWQAQQNAMMGSGTQQLGGDNLGTDQSPHLFENEHAPKGTDQSPVNPINSVRPMGAPLKGRPQQDPNLGMGGSAVSNPGGAPRQMADVCKECGTMHPPLPAGQKCPNASVAKADPSNPNALDDATINKHLVDMRNIIMAQITGKGIKNQKKFFQFAVIELTKALEGYNE